MPNVCLGVFGGVSTKYARMALYDYVRSKYYSNISCYMFHFPLKRNHTLKAHVVGKAITLNSQYNKEEKMSFRQD